MLKRSILVLVSALVGAGITAACFLLMVPSSNTSHDTHSEEDGHGHDHEKKSEGESENVVRLSESARQSAGVRTAQIRRQRLGSVLTTSAVVRPNNDRIAHVSSKVAGRITEIAAVQGTKVKRGDKLLILDSIEMGSAAAEYLKSKAALEVARLNHEREEELMKRNATRGIDFYEAKGSHTRAQADFDASKDRLLLLGWSAVRIDALKWGEPGENSRIEVTAPIDGEVLEKHATIGEVVTPEVNLYTIADLGVVWIEVDVYQRDVAKVHEGQPVEATTEAHPGRVFRGQVTYVGKVIAEETRTLRVRVALPTEGLLTPGMFVSARIHAEDDEHAPAVLAVPHTAVQRIENVHVVFVVKSPGVYERRPVTLGQRYEDYYEVLAGLEGEETVATEGSFILKSELLRSQMEHGHEH